MIVLYPSTYDSNTVNMGYGEITDAISCVVTEVLNGEYTLEMVYPITGRRYPYLQVRNILAVSIRPNNFLTQPFRIMSISKPLNGRVTVLANHISYDLTGYVIAPVTYPVGSAVGSILSDMFTLPSPTNPFGTWTNKTATGAWVNHYNSSLRNCLAGRLGSILDKFGGEFEWDKWTVKLWTRRGADNGVRIEYGKNLTGLTVDTDANNIYSHVQAYWYDSENDDENHGQRIATGATGLERTLMIDASQDYENKPIVTTLNNYATAYIASHDLVNPSIQVSVNFIDLSQTEEYKKLHDLERVDLGDTVTVFYQAMDVDIKTRVKKTVFDVLRDRYTSIVLGNIKAGIVDQIVSNQTVAKDAMTAVQTVGLINTETAKCLKLTGGTMSGQIEGASNGGAYWRGRDYAAIKTTSASTNTYFYPITSNKTQSGTWEIGTYGEDLALHYQSDTDYTNQTNTGTALRINTTGDFTGNAANVTGTVAIANGGTGATSETAALAALFGTAPSFSTPTVGTYASAVSGGYIKYGKIVFVHLKVTSRTSDTTGGTRTMLTGLPNANSASYAAMSVCPSSNTLPDVGCFVNSSGALRFVHSATVPASSDYYITGTYFTD